MKKELIDAIWDLNTEKVSLILNKETKKESNFENMENPLLLAAQLGATDIVRLLLDHGFDVNQQEDTGSTALIWASLGGREETVELLIQKGADVNKKDHSGMTPLLIAALRGKEKIVSKLIEAGAEVDVKDNQQMTPLMWAAFIKRRDISIQLIKAGADVSFINQNGNSALLRAVSQELIAMSQDMIATNSDEEIVEKEKMSVAQLIQKRTRIGAEKICSATRRSCLREKTRQIGDE